MNPTTIAILALVVSVLAMLAAWRAPRAAAQFADEYRKRSAEEESRKTLRMTVFMALMKCRTQILHPDAIAALNLLDVAFMDDPAVRNAYRSFTEATSEQPFEPVKVVERYHSIIEKVAAAMGVGDKISSFDIRAGYYPVALGKLDEAALADAEEKIARQAQRKSDTSA